MIDEDIVSNKVFIHQIPAASGPESIHHAPRLWHAHQSDSSQPKNDEPRQKIVRSLEVEPREASSQTELAVEKSFGQEGRGRRRRYLVRRCLFGLEDNTLEPARNILKDFIVRCIVQICKQTSGQMSSNRKPMRQYTLHAMSLLTTKLVNKPQNLEAQIKMRCTLDEMKFQTFTK